MSQAARQGTSKERVVHGEHRGVKVKAGEWVTLLAESWLSTHTNNMETWLLA